MKATPTRWFKMREVPVREGAYQGRERRTRLIVLVYWRTLEDTPKPGWYFKSGCFGPFQLWENATDKITAWRGIIKD